MSRDSDAAYDRLHGVDGNTQVDPICDCDYWHGKHRWHCAEEREARKFGTDTPHEPSDEFVRQAFAKGAQALWPDSRDPGWQAVFDKWLNERVRESFALNAVEGVGTGAGEGATGQDTGTAWVTRSADCPEAPAQAHPLDTATVWHEGWIAGCNDQQYGDENAHPWTPNPYAGGAS